MGVLALVFLSVLATRAFHRSTPNVGDHFRGRLARYVRLRFAGGEDAFKSIEPPVSTARRRLWQRRTVATGDGVGSVRMNRTHLFARATVEWPAGPLPLFAITAGNDMTVAISSATSPAPFSPVPYAAITTRC